jgi:hypothetical protein
MKFIIGCLALLLVNSNCLAQSNALDSTINKDSTIKADSISIPNYKKRQNIVGVSQAIFFTGTFTALNQVWYANYPRSSFHFYNDGGEWLKMDKAGHGYWAYQMSRLQFNTLQWAGVKNNKAILYASLTGMGYQTVIETLDGFSTKWGWSWNDMAANAIGTGLWASQQYAWGTQKFKLKFSAHYNKNANPQLEYRNNQLFGSFFAERILKDYNAQTYWLSMNIHSIAPKLQAPKWLNIAVGYGAENMYGGFANNWSTPTGDVTRFDLNRYPQWYLSLDVDFEKIPTKSKALKSLFYVLDAIKIPAPSLILANGKLSGQWMYY